MGQKGVYEVPVAANAAAGRGRPVPRASAPSDIAVRQATPVHLPAVWNVLHQAAGPDRTVGRAEAWAVAPPPMTLGQLPAQEPDEAALGLETSSVARQTGGARAGRAALGVQEWPSQPAAATPQPQIGRPPEGISRSDGTARPSLVAEAGVTQPGPDLREAANARPPVPAAPSGEWLTSRPAQAPSPLPAMQPESKELAPDLRVATSPTPPTIRTHQAPEPTGPPWPGAARQAHLSAGEPLTSGTGSGRHRAGTESRATTPPSRLEAAQRPSPDRNTADATERRGGNARATEPQGTGLQHVSLTSAAGAVELRRETPLLAVERTERIAEVVGRAAVEGPHRVEVSLNWEDIGVTRVTVEVAKARARVEVTCASAESASTIRALEQPIRERLASEGLQLQDFRAAPSGEWLTSRPAQAPSPLPAMQPESKELAPDLRVATSPTPPTIRTHQAPEPTGPPWPGAARQAHLSAGEPLTSGTGSGRHRAGTESRATTPPSRLEAAQRPSPDRNTADATERRGGNARATEPQGTGLQHVSLTSAAGAVELRRETPLLAVERTERIAEVVGRAAVEGPHRVEVSLNWEDIGVTRVTVEVAKARARVEVTCASAESASTIRALEQPIRERLASEGLQLQDFRAGHDGEQGRGLWQPREPWNAPHDDSHAPSWPTRPMRPGRALAQPTWQAFARASDGRLDVFV